MTVADKWQCLQIFGSGGQMLNAGLFYDIRFEFALLFMHLCICICVFVHLYLMEVPWEVFVVSCWPGLGRIRSSWRGIWAIFCPPPRKPPPFPIFRVTQMSFKVRTFLLAPEHHLAIFGIWGQIFWGEFFRILLMVVLVVVVVEYFDTGCKCLAEWKPVVLCRIYICAS